MGERAQKILIKANTVRKFYSQWEGQTCYDCLLEGEAGLDHDLQNSKPYEWVVPEFAEGGYLIDFDTKTILLYSWDEKSLTEHLPDIKLRWFAWNVQIVKEGVPDFRAYVQERGLE